MMMKIAFMPYLDDSIFNLDLFPLNTVYYLDAETTISRTSSQAKRCYENFETNVILRPFQEMDDSNS